MRYVIIHNYKDPDSGRIELKPEDTHFYSLNDLLQTLDTSRFHYFNLIDSMFVLDMISLRTYHIEGDANDGQPRLSIRAVQPHPFQLELP